MCLLSPLSVLVPHQTELQQCFWCSWEEMNYAVLRNNGIAFTTQKCAGPQDRVHLTSASSQSYLLSVWLPHPNPPGTGILACLCDRFSHQYCPLQKFSLFTRNLKNAEHWLFFRPSAAMVCSLSLHSAVGRRVVCLQAIYYRCFWAHKPSLVSESA